MLKIKLIAMGRLTEDFNRSAAESYLKRLKRYYSVTVVEPKPEMLSDAPSAAEIERALDREADAILEQVSPRAVVCAMCVEGKTMPSEKFAEWIAGTAQTASEIVFIIGSSFGLSERVKKRADMRLSVSPMTFPHELFRVMLLEQIYRAAEINAGGKYHK